MRPLEFGLLLPRPLREGAGGWGKSLQALLPDNFQDSLDIFIYIMPEYTFNISCVISQFYRIFLKAMTWFHGAFPHPLTPSRKGRGDF
jgi:hypothetical protein